MKRLFISLACALTLFFFCLPFTGCVNDLDYTAYVSEYRSEIYVAEQDGYTLTAFFSQREYPYDADGVCAEKQDLVEIYMTAPDNTQNYDLLFSLEDGTQLGGDMSYDSVHTRFFYSQSLCAVTQSQIKFTISSAAEEIVLQAKSVKTGNELDLNGIIHKLTEQKQTLFEELTAGNAFQGELYVRLVYNEKCYYFIAVSTKQGLTGCFLLDAVTGEILAERQK